MPRRTDLLNKTILLTGGTGSFGKAFIAYLLRKNNFRGVIRVFSRDEFKQSQLQEKYIGDKRLRFFIGDVRDVSRLRRAMEGVDIVVHAAALKQIPILEYNPFEAVKTNILGSQNVIDCALDLGVKKTILISSDKAVSPTNLYGATKMVAEKIFTQANAYVGKKSTRLSVVRYGNVVASRGSVIPKFQLQAKTNVLTITDERMTRFWITLDQGVKFVLRVLEEMEGGEIFVPKLPSVRIIDFAKAIAPNAKIKKIGIRPGEKLHEVLINGDEARHTKEFKNYFIVEPEFLWNRKIKNKTKRGKVLGEEFRYSSESNNRWLSLPNIYKYLKDYTAENG